LTKKQLPADSGPQRAKQKGLRFVLLNVAARVVSHARRLVVKLDNTSVLAKYLFSIRARLKRLIVVGSLVARRPNALCPSPVFSPHLDTSCLFGPYLVTPLPDHPTMRAQQDH